MAPHPPVLPHLSTEASPDILESTPRTSSAQPQSAAGNRPQIIKHMSAPGYQSPLRHHHRVHSSSREVKETLNARSQYSNSDEDGTAEHRINQYLIKQEIGRGSFGAVHLAVDQYGNEYAVKEFSKSRLRKRAQSNLLRRPSRRRPNALSANFGFNSPLHRHSSSNSEPNNSLELIKEEIAIMKKLNHPNLVSLIEVLDDPDEDSLYMVMEMCKKGVVMQVGLEERADPYDEEQCRCWFRDMILGIEYLHAQGIIHRDIKPDNCLITNDDVLKFVDFGVSEMFEKESDMKTAKSAGSPAFMPPELCVAKHGSVDGKAADIWAMGVTLYCLRFGRIPFEKTNMLELYDAIKNDNPDCEEECDGFKDLIEKLLEKDPGRRIKMDELRNHPWVTRNGEDPLLSRDENISIVDEPTDEEVNAAITNNMGHLLVVVKAVKRFKQLLFRRRPDLMEGILGSRIVAPPQSIRPAALDRKFKSADVEDRLPVEGIIASEGVHRKADVSDDLQKLPSQLDAVAISSSEPAPRSNKPKMATAPMEPYGQHTPHASATSGPRREAGKGHAHDPLEDTLFLRIGPGADAVPESTDDLIVSESPSAVDINVYETAYQEEISRILEAKGKRRPTLYLTRRVEGNKHIRENEHIFDHVRSGAESARGGLAKLVEKARTNVHSEGRGGTL